MRGQDEWEQDASDVANDWEEELEDKAEVVATVKPKGTVKSTTKPTAKTAAKSTAKSTPVPQEEEEDMFESEADRRRRSEAAAKRADLQNTMDLFGVDGGEVEIDKVLQHEASLLSISKTPTTTAAANALFGSLDPQSVPEFDKLADLVSSHLNSKFGGRKNYYSFLEALMRKLLANRDLSELRTMSGLVQAMVVAKQKEAKPAPPPAAGSSLPAPAVAAGKKKKPSLLVGAKKNRDLDVTDYGVFDDDDDEY